MSICSMACCVRMRRGMRVQYDISDYREHLYAEILRRRKELKHADRAARDRAKGRSRSYKSSAACARQPCSQR